MPSSWHCWEHRITAFLRGLLNGLLVIAVRGTITAFLSVVCAGGIAGKAELQHLDVVCLVLLAGAESLHICMVFAQDAFAEHD